MTANRLVTLGDYLVFFPTGFPGCSPSAVSPAANNCSIAAVLDSIIRAYR